MSEQLTAVESNRDELERTVIRQRELIARLEADLLSLNAILPKSANGLDANEADFSGKLSTMKMLAKELAVPLKEKINTENDNNDVLSIVSAQRDRLHHRVDELERDLIAQKQTSKYIENERDKVREDNIKLYGKIKFLQSYQSNVGQTSVKIENDETEIRYQNEYEQHLDPFRRFSLQEKQRKYGQLRTYDKAALGLVLYRFAYTESCQRDFQADCIAKITSNDKSPRLAA
uniref:Protein CASP n=1 Tax=Setaria digitata TaxID=48799 RepID=A0A915PEN7_9BILA